MFKFALHYNDVIMSGMTSQFTSLTIVYSIVYSRRRSKKTSKLRVTGLCEGNSPVSGEFPAQRTSNAENVFIWWRHHATGNYRDRVDIMDVIARKGIHFIFEATKHQHFVKYNNQLRNLSWSNIVCTNKRHQYQLIGPWEIWMKFQIGNFKLLLGIDGWSQGLSIFCELTLKWMSLNFTDDESTLDQVMA